MICLQILFVINNQQTNTDERRKFSDPSFYPGHSNNNHPLASFEAGTRQFQYGDDDSSAGSENDLDDDLQLAELAQGQISEALSLEVCPQCSLYIWDLSLFHRDLPGRPQLPLVYPL